MRVINIAVKELQVECPNCHSTIGFIPLMKKGIEGEIGDVQGVDYGPNGYEKYIECPVCHNKITFECNHKLMLPIVEVESGKKFVINGGTEYLKFH